MSINLKTDSMKITEAELMESLKVGNLFPMVGNKVMVKFGLMNKQWHDYLYASICNCVEFEVRSISCPEHYKAKQIKVDYLGAFSPEISGLTSENFFSSPVGNLAAGITHLSFGDFFNSPLDNLPPTITHLTFGMYFNKFVDNLPPTISHITFGY